MVSTTRHQTFYPTFPYVRFDTLYEVASQPLISVSAVALVDGISDLNGSPVAPYYHPAEQVLGPGARSTFSGVPSIELSDYHQSGEVWTFSGGT